MKILDRYILTKFLSAFFFVVAILITVVVVINLTDRMDDFIKHSLGTREILGYYLSFIPFMANFLTPITVFIATVFVTSKMAGHTEIIAILSSGVSFRRMMLPYLIGASIIGALSFALTAYILPIANKKRVAFELAYFKGPFQNTERNIHMKIGPETYAYLESYNNEANVGQKFTLETIKDNQLYEKLTARQLEWRADSSKWVLKDWQLREINNMEEEYSQGRELDTLLSITPKDFGSTYHLHETFTLPELQAYISALRERGADNIVVYEIEKYVRYMSPFTAIILTFIGVIMSSRKSRGGSGLMNAIGFLLAFVYIILFVFTKSIAEAKTFSNPAVAVWVPNILFTLIGLYIYRKIPR